MRGSGSAEGVEQECIQSSSEELGGTMCGQPNQRTGGGGVCLCAGGQKGRCMNH